MAKQKQTASDRRIAAAQQLAADEGDAQLEKLEAREAAKSDDEPKRAAKSAPEDKSRASGEAETKS